MQSCLNVLATTPCVNRRRSALSIQDLIDQITAAVLEEIENGGGGDGSFFSGQIMGGTGLQKILTYQTTPTTVTFLKATLALLRTSTDQVTTIRKTMVFKNRGNVVTMVGEMDSIEFSEVTNLADIGCSMIIGSGGQVSLYISDTLSVPVKWNAKFTAIVFQL